jgi:hypothetical protein
MTLRFRTARGVGRLVPLEPGVPRTVEFGVCSRGPWSLTFSSSSRGFVGNRVVSAQSTEPEVVPSSCTNPQPSTPATAEGQPA